jgi:hypothetical protein
MSSGDLRSSQVITTFGPGGMVDLPDDSIIVAGLDHWHYDNATLSECRIEEPRLVAKLCDEFGYESLSLRKPPPSRDKDDPGFHPHIVGWKFPEWFISRRTIRSGPKGIWRRRRLVHLNYLDGGRFREDDNRKYPVVPVRFVRACRRGHIGDIVWSAFVHVDSEPCGREMWLEERGTTGDLESIFIVCACGLQRSLSQAARLQLRALGNCEGRRPWLGPGNRESCGEPNRLLIRSASNAYFPQLMSVISIPDIRNPVDDVIRSAMDVGLVIVDTKEKLAMARAIPAVAEKLEGLDDDTVWDSIQRVLGGSSNTSRPVKEVEFEALSDAREELGMDEPEGDFYARALPKDKWDAPWMKGIRRIVLAHRLREVVAQTGFTRFEAGGTDIQGELALDVQPAKLGLDADWLPAVENRGEGIFIEFDEEQVSDWLEQESVQARGRELSAGFNTWKEQHENSSREFPGLPYYFLHSLSHLLLNSISLECGYPASSLRERIYAIPPGDGLPGRYGILIYTGSSDAEGTLGGLVLAGREISKHFKVALEMGKLCSNDPVCGYHRPDGSEHQPLSAAACHGCLYVSETSCEQRNEFLDRALVVETVEVLGIGFFK